MHVINTTIQDSYALNGQGGAIYAGSDAIINLFDSHVSTSEANYGGGIFAAWPATLTIVSSTIKGCVAETSGGGVFLGGVATSSSGIAHSVLMMNDSVVNSGIARTYYGGGMYIGGYSEVHLSGTVISSNLGYRHGAGIYFYGSTSFKGSTFTLANRCVVRNNTIVGGGSYHGAGIWLSSDIAGNISGTRFEGNAGAGYGGGKDWSETFP